jgi:hypothetical protein
MKKLILIATIALSNLAGAQNNDYTLELSMFQGLNTRVGMFDAQLTFDNGLFVDAGVYGMNHFFPDYTGGRADDYVNLFVGYHFKPVTSGELAPLVWEIGAGFVADGTGETFTSPTIRTVDVAFRNVLRYPVQISDRFVLSADIGNQFAVGSSNNLKYDFNNIWFVGLTSTLVLK